MHCWIVELEKGMLVDHADAATVVKDHPDRKQLSVQMIMYVYFPHWLRKISQTSIGSNFLVQRISYLGLDWGSPGFPWDGSEVS